MKLRKPVVTPDFIRWMSRLQKVKLNGFFFFPFIFMDREKPVSPSDDLRRWLKIVRHESMHFYQCLECLIILFPIIYGLNLIVNLAIYGNYKDAYRNVCFEREAYLNQSNPDYQRKLFAWVKYLSTKYRKNES